MRKKEIHDTDGVREPSRDSEDIECRSLFGNTGEAPIGAVGTGVTGGTGVIDRGPREQPFDMAPQGPIQRRNDAFEIRHQAALYEKNLGAGEHETNGDEARYPSFIGNFHKTLPHNPRGEVDAAAYNVLLDALRSGRFRDFDAIPAGGEAQLLNPAGGLIYSLKGPDSPAVPVLPPPSVASAELAAQAAELYWMALVRDVPFADYDSDPLVARAAADLSRLSGYTGPRSGSGQVTPQVLFRIDFPGVLDGPMVSQFLLKNFRYDGIPIDPRISTAAPGMDFLTHFDEWLAAQNGFPGGAPGADPRDPVLRYPRSVRDLGRTAGQDAIYSQYFKAGLIILALFGFSDAALDPSIPYVWSSRQRGFASLGFAHLLYLIGAVNKAERHAWYQKWNVHRFLRPEAYGGLVHNHVVGAASYPIHSDVLDSPVLELIFDHNREQNRDRLDKDEGSYLLPQLFRRGSPTHPSFPAGHAISAGACVTVLKAWVNEDLELPDPVKPSADGLSLDSYRVGTDGPALTLGGELNKLAHNLSLGRDMSGVHWRADDVEGLRQGEELAIRVLREEKVTYPEDAFTGFSLTKFDGTTITI